VLADPTLLFWNRANRATKLYKAQEYEPACDAYALALAQMQSMPKPPSDENNGTFHFNYGRSCQSLGRHVKAAELFTETIRFCGSHDRALEQRAECFALLNDYTAAEADWKALHAAAEPTAKAGWSKRLAEARAWLERKPYQVLGVSAVASEAEVRKAYKQACLREHPDKHASSSVEAQRISKHRFAAIQAAYEKLAVSAAKSPGRAYGRAGSTSGFSSDFAESFDGAFY